MIGTSGREGFSTVTPYLMVREVDPVVDFLKKSFSARETFRTTGPAGGTHCEVSLGDSMIMIGGDAPGGMEPKPAALFLYVDDVDALYERALDEGATSLMEPGPQFGEERGAGVEDPFGNQWYMARRTPR